MLSPKQNVAIQRINMDCSCMQDDQSLAGKLARLEKAIERISDTGSGSATDDGNVQHTAQDAMKEGTRKGKQPAKKSTSSASTVRPKPG